MIQRRLLPLPLWIAFAVIIAIGMILLATRSVWTESALYSAISNCGAGVIGASSRIEDKALRIRYNNGIDDLFGVIQFNRDSGQIVRLLSLCETDPAMALRIYRRAMADGNTSARLLAIHISFFLAARGQFETSDFEKIVARLDPEVEKEFDVRKAVQRRLSELIVLNNVTAKAKYETLPPNLPPVSGDAPPREIRTREEGSEGNRFLTIRWSDPDTARAWWKIQATAGAWNKDRGVFVIP
ncbi:MAG: hypothetical protein V1899_04025 [Planctomycetota bacterium]